MWREVGDCEGGDGGVWGHRGCQSATELRALTAERLSIPLRTARSAHCGRGGAACACCQPDSAVLDE